ncbi:MAG: glycosyltransferase family 2 protein [Candidatus Omnitrophica bacterium]|nr:glycosyltransferase family 2 protein [Candidatus Omnitrophota bacterium]
MDKPLLSIVVITYNSEKYIRPCLDSVFSQDFRDFELIVVDNGSRDKTLELVRQHYPCAGLVENNFNLGAAKARNQGLKLSKAEWVLCLDCDICLGEGFLRELANKTGQAPSFIGAIQAKILKSGQNTIYSAGIFLSHARRFHDIGRGRKNSAEFDKPGLIFGGCSAASCYRRKMLSDIEDESGCFDESFFFLVEDVDLSWRAQKKGWKTSYAPSLSCYHHGNSSGFNKGERQYFCFRNRLKMILKNESVFGKIALVPVFLFYDLPRFSILLLRNPKDIPRIAHQSKDTSGRKKEKSTAL